MREQKGSNKKDEKGENIEKREGEIYTKRKGGREKVEVLTESRTLQRKKIY